MTFFGYFWCVYGMLSVAVCWYTLDIKDCYQELNMRETDFLQLPPLKSSAILIGTGDRFILKLLYLCSYRYGMECSFLFLSQMMQTWFSCYPYYQGYPPPDFSLTTNSCQRVECVVWSYQNRPYFTSLNAVGKRKDGLILPGKIYCVCVCVEWRYVLCSEQNLEENSILVQWVK